MDRNTRDGKKISAHFDQSNSHDNQTAKQIWTEVDLKLQKLMSASDYQRWITGLRVLAEVDGEILIVTRDRFEADRVNAEHKHIIQRIWRELDPKTRTIRLECWPSARRRMDDILEMDDPWKELQPQGKLQEPSAGQTGRPAMTFATLTIGPSNEIAVKLARRIAAGQFVGTPTTLIFGPQGVGKTHIAQAIKHEARLSDPDRTIVYMTAEEFMSAYHEGVSARDTSALKRRFRGSDLVLIDDLHRISGKRGTETELFQSIREVTANNGQVVLCGDEAPGNVKGFSARMRSELKGAAAVEIYLPDDVMRREIVERLAAHIAATDKGFVLDEEMVARIVSRIRGPGRELCGAVWSLHTETGFGDTRPTMDMLERVISRHEGEPRTPTIDLVKRAVMAKFAISKAELESACKARSVVYPRQIAMYLCRTMTKKSFPQIAHSIGKRDHATIMYGYRKIEKALKEGDQELRADVEAVRDILHDMQVNP